MRHRSSAALLCAVSLCCPACVRFGLELPDADAAGGDACPCDDAEADGSAEADGDADSDLDEPRPDADADEGDVEAEPCDEEPCRLVAPQCGCAPDLACQTLGTAHRRECVPPGFVPHLEACLGSIECVTAHACVVAIAHPGQCLPYCHDSTDCEAHSFCAEMTTGPDGSCVPMCDPLLGDGCPATTRCIATMLRRLDDGGLLPATVCGPDLTLPGIGEPCDGACRQGAICYGTCYQLCVAPSDCPAGMICRVAGTFSVRGVDYGMCI